MSKKIVLTILLLIMSNLAIAENNSVKIIGPLGLTRSFQNNTSGKVNVVVKVKKSSNNVSLKNIRNGKKANGTLAEKSKNNIFTFSNVTSGVWSITIGNVDDIVSVNIR